RAVVGVRLEGVVEPIACGRQILLRAPELGADGGDLLARQLCVLGVLGRHGVLIALERQHAAARRSGGREERNERGAMRPGPHRTSMPTRRSAAMLTSSVPRASSLPRDEVEMRPAGTPRLTSIARTASARCAPRLMLYSFSPRASQWPVSRTRA